jgi:protein lysine acetyltransferase
MSGLTAVGAEELASLEFFADIPVAALALLAANLRPLQAVPGEVLMRQGEQALSFAIIASGRVEIRHVGPDGHVFVAELPPGLIVGEIALLRHARRTATVIVNDGVCGYLGYQSAFECMLAIPDNAERMVRTARQRLAGFITPIPVRAKDGTELFLRPVLPGDAERVGRGRVEFSPETLYRRFFSGGAPTAAQLTYLCEVDYVDHFVWVVTDGVDGPVVADARFVRDKDDPASAEIALTVADAYQGRGIGTLLLGALAAAARVDGIKRFHALGLSDNVAVRALGDRFQARWQCEEPGVVTTTMEVPALDDLPIKLDAVRQIHHVARLVIDAFQYRHICRYGPLRRADSVQLRRPRRRIISAPRPVVASKPARNLASRL